MCILKKEKNYPDLPGGPVVKNLPASAGDTGSVSDAGRFHSWEAIKHTREPQLQKSIRPRAHVPQQDKPRYEKSAVTISPRQLAKTSTQQRRPRAAKNK